MGLFSSKQDQVEAESAASARRSRRVRSPANDGPLDPLDPLELQKRRARRRLIGAIALVAGAVVLLPMVFDSEPRSGNEDLAVEIPSQDTAFSPRNPATSSAAPAPIAPSTQNTLVPGAPAPASVVPPPTAPLVAPVAPAVTQPASVDTSAPKSKSDNKATPKPAATADDPRALAALEGKSAAPTSESGPAQGFAVQIGAFASTDKVKDVRDRLGAAGLKTYTETLTTPQGPRTRVRVGPFTTREAADKARERVKGLGLGDSSVVSL